MTIKEVMNSIQLEKEIKLFRPLIIEAFYQENSVLKYLASMNQGNFLILNSPEFNQIAVLPSKLKITTKIEEIK